MKFFDCRTAPSPRRVRIFMAEKGIQLETVEIDLAGGEQFGEAFRKINPDCAVPVLQLDDGTCLSEVIAICQYLEAFHPDPALMGRSPEEAALVTMWNAKVEYQGLWANAEAFRNSAKGLGGKALPGPDSFEQIPALAERGRQRVAIFFEKLDQQLAGQPFIVGDYYSVADITAMVMIDFAGWIKIPISATSTNLRRWYDSVSARPSASA